MSMLCFSLPKNSRFFMHNGRWTLIHSNKLILVCLGSTFLPPVIGHELEDGQNIKMKNNVREILSLCFLVLPEDLPTWMARYTWTAASSTAFQGIGRLNITERAGKWIIAAGKEALYAR
jgi:hypothetical protein